MNVNQLGPTVGPYTVQMFKRNYHDVTVTIVLVAYHSQNELPPVTVELN